MMAMTYDRVSAGVMSVSRVLRPVFGAVLAASFGLAPVEQAAARSPDTAMSAQATPGARRINMGVGKSVILDLPADAAEIFVGNPSVANAVVRTARKLYVIGVAAGQTSIYALDRQGHQFASFEVSIGRDIGELSQILHAAMPATEIVPRTINDTIILTGTVDSAEEAQRAEDIAKGFAKQVNGTSAGAGGLVINSLVIRGRDQVMLKVTISEMRRDIIKQLGVTSSTWGPLTQGNQFPLNGTVSGVSDPSGSSSILTSALKISSGGNLSAQLQAFERYGVSRTLAEPTVSAISGESAKFTVGGQFPYPSGTICTGTGCFSGGVSFKDYGITLNFSPTVLSEGRILLHLATEVTDIDFTNSVTVQGVPTPGLLTRKNETTIELPSGGSIATAGLIQQQTRQTINGLPGLLNIPILGTLFRSRDYLRNETELVVIVTPVIIKPTKANQIARPDDGFVDASDPQTWLLGRVNKLYATPSNPEAVKNYRGPVGFIQD